MLLAFRSGLLVLAPDPSLGQVFALIISTLCLAYTLVLVSIQYMIPDKLRMSGPLPTILLGTVIPIDVFTLCEMLVRSLH